MPPHSNIAELFISNSLIKYHAAINIFTHEYAKLIISNKEYEDVERFIGIEVPKGNLVWVQEHTQQKEEIVLASNKFGDVYALGVDVMMMDEDGKDVQCEVVSFDREGGVMMVGLYTGNEIVRMDINDLH